MPKIFTCLIPSEIWEYYIIFSISRAIPCHKSEEILDRIIGDPTSGFQAILSSLYSKEKRVKKQ
jgi:hypothetical protein